ncbi:MAG TPA: GNAT family protein [Gammaproteobacteria bacterium]|jgi:RimJ/RimL family protein N-acetyltransferase|nr:GNAT family protein [Gammaproteobacteria bacterium]
MICIRPAILSDAPNISQFTATLDSESEFLLYGTGERNNDADSTTAYLTRLAKSEKSIVLLAENMNKKIVGFLCGEVSHIKRISHIMKVNIGILRDYRGTQVSRLLSECVYAHARRKGIVRIEATVITKNKFSLNLCKKFGFKIEGIRESSIKIGDIYYDEYLLATIL